MTSPSNDISSLQTPPLQTTSNEHLVVPSATKLPEWLFPLKLIFRKIFLALMFILTILIAQGLTQKLSFSSQAATGTAHITIKPSDSSLSNEASYQLWGTMSEPTGFIRVTLTFDPTLLMLTQDPTIITENFTTIQITNTTEANNTGKITYIGGLDVSKRDMVMQNTFHILTLHLSPKPQISDAQTTIRIDASDSQIISTNVTSFTLTSEDARIVVNPSTPTVSPTAAPLQTITPSPVQEAGNPIITTTSIKNAIVGQYYATKITAFDKTQNSNISLSALRAPKGISLKNCTKTTLTNGTEVSCILTGKPAHTGSYNIKFVATNTSESTAKNFTMEVMTLLNFIQWFFKIQ